MVRKVKKPRGSMEPICATAQPISVLIADSNQMQCQLLVGALRRRPEFRVAFCSADMNLMLNAIAASSVQVAILNTDHPKNGRPDMTHASQIAFGAPRGGKDSLAGILRPRPRGQRLPLRRQRAVRFFRVSFPPALQVHTKRAPWPGVGE